jgi:hypothetical protein
MPSFLKFKLEVTDPAAVIERRIRIVIADKINIAANVAVKKVRPKIIDIVRNAVLGSPEVASLNGGQLQAELGAKNSEIDSVLNFLITRLSDTISLDVIPFSAFSGNIMRGHLRLRVFPKFLINELIHYSEASFKTKKGVELPWVRWLLKLGDKIIVKNYTVNYTKVRGSRTGLATMTKTKGRGWRVPPEFSGTENDNFITRALDDVADLMMYHLRLEFSRAL